MRPRNLYFCLAMKLSICVGIVMLVQVVQAQMSFTRTNGQEDIDVPTPSYYKTSGQRIDSTALTEIEKYKTAVGISVWNGMSAQGQIIDSGNRGMIGKTISIELANHRRSRMDIFGANENTSIRINGTYAAMRTANTIIRYLPPQAAVFGVLGIEQLLDMQPAFMSGVNLIDRGNVVISGNTLRRITIEYLVNSDQNSTGKSESSSEFIRATQSNIVIDYYFDQNTNILSKSAALVVVPDDKSLVLECISYSKYNNVNGIFVPTIYSQSFNGQMGWVIQLSQINIKQDADTVNYEFNGSRQ